MNEQMEKLAEGIIDIAAGCVSIEEEPLCCFCAEKIAILIGNAVLSGKYPELDEVFGVVGRFETEGELGEKVLRRALNILARQGATEFIARREEGQKEEEK